ncbi:hypothetical protein BDN72DRAFT_550114 [Pluteus cervinus]|uniref:Uncharacterized protein n=1 Tax=Pluteus cervinus TaxID=181527 RepID=A0ACD3A5H0_9AGAR|nr:hypothetical protein BDN72DRAFT_550114 [Pluteus cervinus]
MWQCWVNGHDFISRPTCCQYSDGTCGPPDGLIGYIWAIHFICEYVMFFLRPFGFAFFTVGRSGTYDPTCRTSSASMCIRTSDSDPHLILDDAVDANHCTTLSSRSLFLFLFFRNLSHSYLDLPMLLFLAVRHARHSYPAPGSCRFGPGILHVLFIGFVYLADFPNPTAYTHPHHRPLKLLSDVMPM